jgi:CO/xanthine dehydrogenase Mo-binding subunit
VRFVGEPVAAVAAVDRHVAEEALLLIAVDYERCRSCSITKRR